ncbi:hypothetical protein [Polaribacter dokdonensis]|uniref:hypothetical protein n=1 Tax=Polaribacter dokdonensis TaxID=326329 RepID=UPI0006B4A6BB|nr:hypothetical protein [Polaribacter dokdonensis]
MKTKFGLLFFFLVSITISAQKKDFPRVSNKGKIFVYWGWNRATYSNSDISFKGNNYDFTLQDVVAYDRPTDFSYNDYFKLDRITIPQTNFRIGYFLNDHYTVSVGVDHMKYVVQSYQTVKINGEINAGTPFDGVYNNNDIDLINEFLLMEHTDGLNYVNLEVKRFDEIGHLIGISDENLQLNITEGIGAGFLYPRTDIALFNQTANDEFNVSGWGVSIGAGLNLTFFKHFFIQSDLKYGYIDMSNIRTTQDPSDTASQSFTFFEKTLVFGAKFNLF